MQDTTRQNKSTHDNTIQANTIREIHLKKRQYKPTQSKTILVNPRQHKTIQDNTIHYATRQENATQYFDIQGTAGQDNITI